MVNAVGQERESESGTYSHKPKQNRSRDHAADPSKLREVLREIESDYREGASFSTQNHRSVTLQFVCLLRHLKT